MFPAAYDISRIKYCSSQQHIRLNTPRPRPTALSPNQCGGGTVLKAPRARRIIRYAMFLLTLDKNPHTPLPTSRSYCAINRIKPRHSTRADCTLSNPRPAFIVRRGHHKKATEDVPLQTRHQSHTTIVYPPDTTAAEVIQHHRQHAKRGGIGTHAHDTTSKQ